MRKPDHTGDEGSWVADFKISKIDVELGAGFGFTTGSDRFVLKAILGYAFPVATKSGEDALSVPLKMGTSARSPQNAWAAGCSSKLEFRERGQQQTGLSTKDSILE